MWDEELTKDGGERRGESERTHVGLCTPSAHVCWDKSIESYVLAQGWRRVVWMLGGSNQLCGGGSNLTTPKVGAQAAESFLAVKAKRSGLPSTW